MKPAQAKIADLWCRLMHTAPMWPSHGQYECWTCGRRRRVCWEAPAPLAPRLVRLTFEAQNQRAKMAVVTVIADQYSAKIRQEPRRIAFAGETNPE
jgi:hypothetical protein